MKTDSVSNIDFKGKLVIVNELSNKPKKCIDKVQGDIQKLVKPKDYNLFIQQNYGKNVMCIIADYPFPLKPSQKIPLFTRTQINIPITSKASKYVATAKDVMDEFEYSLHKKEQQEWEKEQRKQKIDDVKNIIEYILLSPIYITEMFIYDISPKLGKKFEKLLDKIGI